MSQRQPVKHSVFQDEHCGCEFYVRQSLGQSLVTQLQCQWWGLFEYYRSSVPSFCYLFSQLFVLHIIIMSLPLFLFSSMSDSHIFDIQYPQRANSSASSCHTDTSSDRVSMGIGFGRKQFLTYAWKFARKTQSSVQEWKPINELVEGVIDLRAMRTLERLFDESMINLCVMTLQWRYFCLLCWFRFMLMYVNKALYMKLCIWNTWTT